MTMDNTIIYPTWSLMGAPKKKLEMRGYSSNIIIILYPVNDSPVSFLPKDPHEC